MKSSSSGLKSKITHAGIIACDGLTPTQYGSVLAAFSKAIYLQPGAGELFLITTEEAPLHRRSAQIPSPLPNLKAGSPYQVIGNTLIIDHIFKYEMEQVSEWREPCSGQVLDAASLYSRVNTFFKSLDYSPARGFGIFIPSILSLNQEAPAYLEPELSDSVLRFAHPLAMSMARICLEHQFDKIIESADALIGFGAGLTPSGDDFLGGVLFAIKILQLNYPDLFFADFIVDMESFHSRTNLISYTFLNDLANGHAVAPLHHIIYGLLSGKGPDLINPSVSQLTQIGHSTGWDLLTGLLVGLLTVYRSHCLILSLQAANSMEI